MISPIISRLALHEIFAAPKSSCKTIVEEGNERRIYVGEENKTAAGTPCLSWSDLDHEYGDYEGVGDHNYCRNPGNSRSREWCYISTTKKVGYCGVRTCGNTGHTEDYLITVLVLQIL